ncbi:efflux RND transporter periplasmic adaptor subunit [Algoriphagus sp. NF]|jgi:membrane fusion protein (multidrug efflux system)|uniref:efflux RND transporter periplasmic adaptor subunit n=1 Tax=Algoriphagus sp. NF TaxID=2992756 RepID=UPI0010653BD3|nr:efflux RND transporter periplasmic adaptor subunit [Algoriphagus sp. NF]MDE0561671.1 efflux RND transporter periplasmic adaptor subunit [Algoriphagus sp. NF]
MKTYRNLLFLAVGCAFLISSCGASHTTHEEAGTFKVSQPIQQDTVLIKEYVSQIRAIQHIELRALEKGYLQKIFVDEGQHVKKGQLLFQIQPTIYQAEFQKAQSEVEFARVEYENIKALADKDIVSQNEAALAKAQLEKAKAELALAQAHLTFTEVRAPFDGIVGKFEEVRLGSLLDEGELLTTLSDNSKMWVYFNVPESEYLDYAMSSNDSLEVVKLRLANNRLFSESGVIETIESDFNNTTGNIAFRATFSNPNGLLRHGQTGNILWPKPLEGVTMIPQKATFEVLDKKFVYLVDKEGTIQSREVKVEGELNHIYLISSGLKSTDTFLLEGLRKVENGKKIHFELINPTEVLEGLHLHAE